MKYFCLIVVFLAACTPSAKEVTPPVLPEDLKDCKFFDVSDGASTMKIARCQNSTTSISYRSGKVTKSTITVDGVEYVKK